LDNRVQTEIQEHLDKMARTEQKAWPVPLEQRVQVGRQVILEAKDKVVLMGPLERLDPREPQEHKDLKDRLDKLVMQDHVVQRVKVESLVHRDKRVLRDLLEVLVPRDRQEV
jgi:dGTP triphosphohydrolase